MRNAYYDTEHHATISLMPMPTMNPPGHLITSVEVFRTNRRKGVATRLMQAVCQVADMEQAALYLSVQSDGTGPDDDQLRDWYATFGFVMLIQDPSAMIRYPKEQ